MQSVAECLAKHWKGPFEKDKNQMREFTASELAGVQDEETATVSVRKAGDTLPAQITMHPVTAQALQNSIASEVQTESVADAARRLKAERAAEKAKAQP